MLIGKQGDFDDCSIFYINDGEVDIVVEGSIPGRKTHIKTLKVNFCDNIGAIEKFIKNGQVFGEFSFFAGQSRIVTAKSRVFSNVFEVKRDDFIRILQGDRKDYDQFCMIKDELLFNGKTSVFKSRCLTCGRTSHNLVSCNYFHFTPNREKIVKKHEFSLPQTRMNFQRKAAGKENARGMRKKCVVQAKLFNKNLFLIKQKQNDSPLFDSEKSSFMSIEDPFMNLAGALGNSNESFSNINFDADFQIPEIRDPVSEQLERKETHHVSLPPAPEEEGIFKFEEKKPKCDEKYLRAEERGEISLRSDQNRLIPIR